MVEQKLCATLITGIPIEQGVGKELGKGSVAYYDSCAVYYLDKQDMRKPGTKNGSVIVEAKKYQGSINPGMVCIPWGSWANFITGDETYNMGMPLFKGFPVPGILTDEELLGEILPEVRAIKAKRGDMIEKPELEITPKEDVEPYCPIPTAVKPKKTVRKKKEAV